MKLIKKFPLKGMASINRNVQSAALKPSLFYAILQKSTSVVVEAENSPKPRKKLYKAETWPDDKGLYIESPKKCLKIPPTRNPILRNGNISSPHNEFKRSSRILVQTNPDAHSVMLWFLALLIVDVARIYVLKVQSCKLKKY